MVEISMVPSSCRLGERSVAYVAHGTGDWHDGVVPMQAHQRRGVEVVAHRGASDDVAEHTLAAYVRAIEDGADALECDVRLTADGHLVCVHDRRVDRTSNGRGAGLDARARRPRRARLRLVARAGAGRRRGARARDRRRGRGADAASGCSSSSPTSGRRVELAIETKHPTRYGGPGRAAARRAARAASGWTRAPAGEPSPVRVMSFSQLSLRRMRQLAPAVPTGAC